LDLLLRFRIRLILLGSFVLAPACCLAYNILITVEVEKACSPQTHCDLEWSSGGIIEGIFLSEVEFEQSWEGEEPLESKAATGAELSRP
jgi:hypothetical protein